MMGVGEENTKERISMMMMKYSVLKDVLKFHECGWSDMNMFAYLSISIFI
jgi:hypothetical protein